MKTHQINLGQCSSKLDALHKIHAWAKKSKSFTINRIRRESYVIFNNRRVYFAITVTYYSRKNEGKYQLGAWNYSKHLLYKTERFDLIKNLS